MQKITTSYYDLGCDPELFFEKNGKIIPSEKVIPEQLWFLQEYNNPTNDVPLTQRKKYSGVVVQDGIQVELNPRASHCREILANDLRRLFTIIKKQLDKKENKGVKLNFEQVVKVSKATLNKSSSKCRTFGCMPSFNAYLPKEDNISRITVDPSVYLYRGGGGHIHIGLDNESLKKLKQDYAKAVKVFDIIVGNTCVIIDRHPLNVERRKNYGKAGEYRTPKYGLEYRTLSNFWLKDYRLFSLVTGLSRIAINFTTKSTEKNNYVDKLLSLVNEEDIINAINNNDKELALKNFNKVKAFIVGHLFEDDSGNPLTKKRLLLFEHFMSKPLNYWFKEDSLTQWTTKENHQIGGFERFLEDKVLKDYQKTYKNDYSMPQPVFVNNNYYGSTDSKFVGWDYGQRI